MRGNITVSANATLSLINGGRIMLDDLNALKIEENGTLHIKSGYLELIN